MKRILFFCAALLPLSVFAQPYFPGFQQEYFFGNLPSVRAEAMGRASVAVGESVPTLFFNPAGIGLIQNQEAVISTSAPFYVLRESDYYFLGFARRLHPKWVAAASINQFAVGPTTFDVEIGGIRYPADAPKTTNLALSGAGEVLPGLQVGANLNLLRWTYLDEVSAAHTLHFDAGALYTLELNSDPDQPRQLRLGASLTNLAFGSIRYRSPTDFEATSKLPAILRIGAAFAQESPLSLPGAAEGSLGLLLTAEYQELLNSEYRSAFSLGMETVWYQVLVLRLGYFTRSENDFGVANNKSRIEDLTYGFGLILPIDQLTGGNWPVKVHFDYVGLKQPPFVEQGSRQPNMRSFSLRLVWIPGETR